MLTWIQGGRVIDPGHLDTVADIFIKDNKIVRIIKEGQKSNPFPG
jgi:dihydroorotase-like cyclic amidohydrolase